MKEPVLYVTADRIGAPTGGGQVTYHELEALKALGGTVALFRPADGLGPFEQDADVLTQVRAIDRAGYRPKLAHVYAGCFTQTVKYLKSLGCRVSYTVAAHDVGVSRKAHEELGLPFDYPHLNDPALFREYAGGYLEHADVVIVPGRVPALTVRRQGRLGPVEVIPHGHSVAAGVAATARPRPTHSIGYLGAYGPDKGVITLLRAWKLLRERPRPCDLTTLALAGRDSLSPGVQALIRHAGASAVRCLGWQESVEGFYRSLGCYVQPSMTEGFGIEVSEARACGTPVFCSDGAGAVHLLDPSAAFGAGDHEALAGRLDHFFRTGEYSFADAPPTWEAVRGMYVKLWRGLLP